MIRIRFCQRLACSFGILLAAGTTVPAAAGADALDHIPPGAVAIEAEADTYMRFGLENVNEGADAVLRIRDPANRVLVRFSQAAIDNAVRGRVLKSAALRLCIVFNNQQWSRRTPGGKAVQVHRVTRFWSEDEASWNRPVFGGCWFDAPPCDRAEQGGAFTRTPTASLQFFDDTDGCVAWDVTADVEAFLCRGGRCLTNNGWLLKKEPQYEDDPGRVLFLSRDGRPDPDQEIDPPLLVLVTSVPPTPTVDANPAPTPTPLPAGEPRAGDCDGDGEVVVNEVVLALNVVLGNVPLSSCPSADADGNGQVTVEEIVALLGR